MKLIGWMLLGMSPLIFIASTWADSASLAYGWALGLVLATWAVMGGNPPVWRLVVSVVPFVIFISVNRVPTFGAIDDEAYVLAMIVTVGYGIPFLIVRAMGLQLQHAWKPSAEDAPAAEESTANQDGSATPAGKLQFSIGSIFSHTTALAVLLSCFSTVEILSPGCLLALYSQPADAIEAFMVFAIAPVAMWTALGTGSTGKRFWTLALACAVALFIVVFLIGAEYGWLLHLHSRTPKPENVVLVFIASPFAASLFAIPFLPAR